LGTTIPPRSSTGAEVSVVLGPSGGQPRYASARRARAPQRGTLAGGGVRGRERLSREAEPSAALDHNTARRRPEPDGRRELPSRRPRRRHHQSARSAGPGCARAAAPSSCVGRSRSTGAHELIRRPPTERRQGYTSRGCVPLSDSGGGRQRWPTRWRPGQEGGVSADPGAAAGRGRATRPGHDGGGLRRNERPAEETTPVGAAKRKGGQPTRLPPQRDAAMSASGRGRGSSASTPDASSTSWARTTRC